MQLEVDKSKIPQDVFDIAGRLRQNGFKAYLVGGAVRDIIFGREPKDYDILTDAACGRVGEIFRNVVPYGITHGTVIVVKHGVPYDVTSYNEGEPAPGSLENDLGIRDFTINAMACDLFDLKLIDPFGGVNDFNEKKIKCVLNPEDRIAKDPLRILRALRQAAQFEFAIEEKTLQTLKNRAEWILKPAPERVASEIIKLFECGRPAYSVRLLLESNVMENILNKYFNVHGASLKAVNSLYYDNFIKWHENSELSKFDYKFKLSIFIAYITAFSGENETYKSLTKKLLALKFSRDEAETIAATVIFMFEFAVLPDGNFNLIKSILLDNAKEANVEFVDYNGGSCGALNEQMFINELDNTEIEIKNKILNAYNVTHRKNTCELSFLAVAELFKILGLKSLALKFYNFSIAAKEMAENKTPIFIEDLAVNGEMMMKELNILKPGKFVGEMLKLCQNAVINDPLKNNYDELLAVSRSFFNTQKNNI